MNNNKEPSTYTKFHKKYFEKNRKEIYEKIYKARKKQRKNIDRINSKELRFNISLQDFNTFNEFKEDYKKINPDIKINNNIIFHELMDIVRGEEE